MKTIALEWPNAQTRFQHEQSAQMTRTNTVTHKCFKSFHSKKRFRKDHSTTQTLQRGIDESPGNELEITKVVRVLRVSTYVVL